MDPTLTASDIQAAIKAGLDQAQLLPDVAGHHRAVIVPKTADLRVLAREKLVSPRFLTANPLFHDPAAFIAYFNKFADDDSRIFYTSEGQFLAVFDYHQMDMAKGIPKARHGDHTATLLLVRSPEWKDWSGSSDKPKGQQEFAEFIEDHIDDLIKPDPETMLRVATGLHATVGATFRQATNQANGQINLSYEEQINGTVNGKDEAIPSTFEIALRPFMGCDRYPINCRLRYRIDRSSGAALRLHFKALNLDRITEAAVQGVVGEIATKTSKKPALGTHDAKVYALGV